MLVIVPEDEDYLLSEDMDKSKQPKLTQSEQEDSKDRESQLTIDEIEVKINKRLPEKVPCPFCRKTGLTMVRRERSQSQKL